MKNTDTIYKLSTVFYSSILKVAGGKQFKKQMDKKYLNSMHYIEEIRSYLLSLGYRIIGIGGGNEDGGKLGDGREVYLISSKKVLKVAATDFGFSQNEVEYNALHGNSSNFLPKAYDKAPDYRWIEVEVIRQLKSWEEFAALAGIGKHEFMDILVSFRYQPSIEAVIDSNLERFYKSHSYAQGRPDDDTEKEFLTRRALEGVARWKAIKNNPVLQEMSRDVVKYNISLDDVDHLDNLGVSANGHLVFLDLGFKFEGGMASRP